MMQPLGDIILEKNNCVVRNYINISRYKLFLYLLFHFAMGLILCAFIVLARWYINEIICVVIVILSIIVVDLRSETLCFAYGGNQ